MRPGDEPSGKTCRCGRELVWRTTSRSATPGGAQVSKRRLICPPCGAITLDCNCLAAGKSLEDFIVP